MLTILSLKQLGLALFRDYPEAHPFYRKAPERGKRAGFLD
jgi:hypothetical protein